MYGDCQVLSSMGGSSIIPSDNNSLYTSNPNFNFMATINPFSIFPSIIPKEEISGVAKSRDEIESGNSGSEHFEGMSVAGNDQLEAAVAEEEEEAEELPRPLQGKRKRYHRHTSRQIQEMEALFKENPHPDDKQRLRLSQELGLKPRQVKFWFQNRRTQMKAQQDRKSNVGLRAENESLKKENYSLQVVLRNITCPDCGGPAMLGEMGYDEQQLRIENARLKEEFDRVCYLIGQYTGTSAQALGPNPLLESSLDLDMPVYPRKLDQLPISGCPSDDHHMINPLPFMLETSQFPGTNCLIMEEEKSLALEMAMSAVDELVKMCHTEEPLWIPSASADDLGRPHEVLNLEEYERMFSGWSAAQHPGDIRFRTEATRETAMVIMNSITLVDALMDANKWMDLFPSIISSAKLLQLVHPGVSGQANGSLLLMHAEVQFLSPLVAIREAHFLRYCQHDADDGSWVIVDFPLDGLHSTVDPSHVSNYRRRPSGCIIQDMPNGYSRVTWVEHAEVEDGPTHRVFNHLVTRGMAFGARRWLSVLQCQCERLASLMAQNISDLGVIPSLEARKNLMNMAWRMTRTFCLNISSNAWGQSWTALSDSDDDTVRVTIRKVTETGQPNGHILSAVSTTWLPYQHSQVFDFLRDERRRIQVEVLSNGNSLHEVAHIANGSHPGNCISLYRINVASNSSQTMELVLQESCSDESGSLVVYSTINIDALQLAMNGEDPSCIPLLPMGFVIVPSINNDATTTHDNSGCLLTVGLQVLASTMPSGKLNLSSITAINHHLCNAVKQINAALGSTNISNHENDDIIVASTAEADEDAMNKTIVS